MGQPLTQEHRQAFAQHRQAHKEATRKAQREHVGAASRVQGPQGVVGECENCAQTGVMFFCDNCAGAFCHDCRHHRCGGCIECEQ